MKRWAIRMTWLVGVFLLCFWARVNAASEEDFLGMITGGEETTAYRVGSDIAALVEAHDIHLTVYPSRGAVENIHALYQRPGNHLGLVAADVLAFVARVDSDPRLKLIANKIKWIFPLYDQEVHLIGRREITGFNDLRGRRVAIGDAQNGGNLTSRLLFEVSGVEPRELAAMGGGEALAALRQGRIDAIITVDGFPVRWLARDIALVDGMHLIPITDTRIRSFYPTSTIPGGTYAWQPTDVATVSVKTVLLAYDFRNQYCQTIGKLAWLIRENLDWLRQHGHPKWKTVNLDEAVNGWEPYVCVIDYTPPTHPNPNPDAPVNVDNPVVDAIQAVFPP
jgi:uncharacterized protein